METADAVFADYLTVTVPADCWFDLRGEVEPVLQSIGMAVAYDTPGDVLWRAPGDSGTVKAKRMGAVVAVGASGAVLAGLRAHDLLTRYLSQLGSRPHRVTRLDASLDRREPTPPVIHRLTEAAVSADGIALSRKRVDPRHVTRLVSRTRSGEDTGTVYLGSSQAEVRMCVYDKQAERIARDLPDCGPITRYELRLKSKTGVTLRDVAEPAPVFWHYAAPDVLSRPEGVPEWNPHAEGFVIPPRDVPLPAARLVARVQASAEAAALMRLADECGPYGRALLFAEMAKLVPVGDGDAPRLTRAGVGEAHVPPGPPAHHPPAAATRH